jgi:hypothetical protein
MQVRPGDVLSAAVTVSGHRVQLELSDLTRHHKFSRTLRAASIDVSSAEWILEAPSECTSNVSCQTLPLADFGTASFSRDRVVTTAGHRGGISNRQWGISEITLTTGGGRHFIDRGASGAHAYALPSSLSSGGSSFTVTYRTGVTSAFAAASASAARSAARLAASGRPGTIVR